jgi:hypothetical protein
MSFNINHHTQYHIRPIARYQETYFSQFLQGTILRKTNKQEGHFEPDIAHLIKALNGKGSSTIVMYEWKEYKMSYTDIIKFMSASLIVQM